MSLSLSLSLSLSFCEWMGQTNTTFMEMASCALKSNGAAAVREQAGGEKKMRREGSGRKTHTKGKWCRCQKRYLLVPMGWPKPQPRSCSAKLVFVCISLKMQTETSWLQTKTSQK